MLSRAITRPSHSLTRATKGFHRIAAAGVAIAGVLASYTTANGESARKIDRAPSRNISHIANMRELIQFANAAPDPSTECALSTVTCVGPTGDWVATAQTALDAGQDVYLTDGDLATEDDYRFPLPNSPVLTWDDLNQALYGEGPFNTTVRRDGTSSIFHLRGNGNSVSDLRMMDAQKGIVISGDNYDNILILQRHMT